MSKIGLEKKIWVLFLSCFSVSVTSSNGLIRSSSSEMSIILSPASSTVESLFFRHLALNKFFETFLEHFLMEHIDLICSLDSKLFFLFICFIGISSISRVIFKKEVCSYLINSSSRIIKSSLSSSELKSTGLGNLGICDTSGALIFSLSSARAICSSSRNSSISIDSFNEFLELRREIRFRYICSDLKSQFLINRISDHLEKTLLLKKKLT